MELGDVVKRSNLISIVMRSLAFIDARLVDHGERVAYIADRIAAAARLDIDRDKLLILCLLHDVGAYKTEEIDEMVKFETNNVLNHAAYGYVFLKNVTALGSYAEAILYHHTPYEELSQVAEPQRTAAELIFLADRADILLAMTEAPDWGRLRQLGGSVFSPALVEALIAAEERDALSSHVLDGSYRELTRPLIENIALSTEEIVGYLKMLVYSIDFRSPFTVTHTANTTAISDALAELFGLDPRRRGAVAQGAFLHDIGKISIPYNILENPGRLSPEQMEIMKTHVAVSEEILRGVVPEEVCLIAVRHHEKLNGKGYHRGLSGDELSLAQRIVAVSDVLSALINRRSYKEAFPKERALSILSSMRDAGELCPRVCNMVIDNYDYIMDIISRSDDPVIKLYETIRQEYHSLLGLYA